jgi:hypothetical protein
LAHGLLIARQNHVGRRTMQVRRGIWSVRRGWMAAIAIVCCCGLRLGANAGTGGLAPNDAWDTFSADISIQRSTVNAAGEPIGTGPQRLQYHWEQSQTTDGWKTSMTLSTAGRHTVQSLSGPMQVDEPLAVTRIENDGDGAPPRMYDDQGRLVQLPSSDEMLTGGQANGASINPLRALMDPTAPSQPPSFGREWIERVMATPSRQASRREALDRRYGKSLERIGGLDRFLTASGDQMTELLVDPDSSLPVEINLVKDGTLVAHTTFAYQSGVAGSQIRRLTHSERLLPGNTGERAVIDVEVTNVRLERRGGGAR